MCMYATQHKSAVSFNMIMIKTKKKNPISCWEWDSTGATALIRAVRFVTRGNSLLFLCTVHDAVLVCVEVEEVVVATSVGAEGVGTQISLGGWPMPPPPPSHPGDMQLSSSLKK